MLQIVGGAGTAHGEFNSPTDLAISVIGGVTHLFIADTYNDRVEDFVIS